MDSFHLCHRSILVFEATSHPALSTRIVFECKLHEGYDHSAIFMNSTAVGVARICGGGSMEIQTFNLRDANHSTVIITDRVRFTTIQVPPCELTLFSAPISHFRFNSHWRHDLLYRSSIRSCIGIRMPAASPGRRRAV